MTIPQILRRTLGSFIGGRYIDRMTDVQLELKALDAKLRSVLPPAYASYEDVRPISMGSAGLKYDPSGRVAWDEIWGSFCDLAMAGGPPHKGKLLEPGTDAEIAVQPDRYRWVLDEICRGIRMVSDLAVEPSPNLGWVRLHCSTRLMASWLVRAIVMENVSARRLDNVVELPAGPHFRIEKEIKNVVTVIAKTWHYFDGHIEYGQQQRIEAIFEEAEAKSPLLQPGQEVPSAACRTGISERLCDATGLRTGGVDYSGWLGIEANNVYSAVWMMRALVVSNVLARREGTVLYVPLNAVVDPKGEILISAVSTVHRLATARGLRLDVDPERQSRSGGATPRAV